MFIDRSSLLIRKYNNCHNCRPKGVRNEKLYHIYHGMKQRCYNSNNPKFKYYGGKGITVCPEWMESYDTFKNWAINNGYITNMRLSIDRVDSDKDYSPENCRWIPISENSARSNYGRQKNTSTLKDMYAISPDGIRINIVNISKFCRDYSLNLSSVGAALRGISKKNTYHGWTFYSTKTL